MRIAKYILLSFFILFISSCKNVTIKKIITKDSLTIKWYWESKGDSDKDYITVTKYFSKDIIMELDNVHVTDVFVKKDTIFIKMFEPKNAIIYSLKKSSFGLAVKIDSSASYNDWLKIYQPEYYKK